MTLRPRALATVAAVATLLASGALLAPTAVEGEVAPTTGRTAAVLLAAMVAVAAWYAVRAERVERRFTDVVTRER